MSTTRMTSAMRRSLERRLVDLGRRLATLEAQRDGDDSVEIAALVMQLAREHSQVEDALQDAMLIDDEPFDVDAIEIGDTVTVVSDDGEVERYILVDDAVGLRARSDWVSIGSPLGKAILGRSKGDRVDVESPQGPLTYVILDFERRIGQLDRADRVRQGISADARKLLPSEAFLG